MKQKSYKLIILTAIILVMPMIGWAQTFSVTTLAGSGNAGNANGTGTAAEFENPTSAVVDANGNIFITDRTNDVIRRITPEGVVTTFAGSGTAGFADGTGTAARFNNPSGIAIDASGNLYVADRDNHNIRRITPAGVVTTLAGSTTTPAQTGTTNATGTAARFNGPTGVAVDASGNVFVADASNHRIRRVTPAGVVTTFAGNGSGNTNGTGTSALFNLPSAIAIDGSGNLYVADRNNHRIRKITSAAVVTTLAGSTQGFNNATGTAAQFNSPRGIAVDASGNVYVADHSNELIRLITPSGVVTTLAGSQDNAGLTNGIGTAAEFDRPTGIALDASANIYVAEEGNDVIRKIFPCNLITPTISGATSVCSGSSTTFTTTYTLGTNEAYLWSTGATTQNLTVSAAGTYSLRIRNTVTGCTSSASTGITVSVTTLPTTPTITGATSICAGGSTALTTTRTLLTNEAYLWSNGITTQSNTVSTAGTYSLRIRNTVTGCTSAASTGITVTVNALPTTPTISGSNSICSGSNTTLTTTYTLGANEAYLWSTGATTQNLTVSTAGTYSLRIRNTATGCTSAASTAITTSVNTIPTTPGTFANTATAICTGGSASLTTWSTLGTNEAYLWSNGATTQTINPTVTGSYTLRIRNTVTGCTSAASTPAINITVNPLPGTPTITGANTFCAGGGSTTLTPSTALGTNEAYLWSDFSSGNTLAVNYAGTFSLRIRNTVTGCTSAVSNSIVVSESAVPTTVNAVGATSICAGTSTILTPSRALLTNEAYLWSDNSSASTLTVTTAGTYSVRVRNTVTGCTSYTGAPVTVSVTTLPTTPTISGSNSICSGSNTTLTTTYTLGANEAYLWSTGATTQNLTVSTAGTYSLRIRNTLTGCTSAVSNSITVTTNTAPGSPDIFPLSGTTVCSGTTVILGTLAGIIGDEERLWSTGETGFTISPTVSGSYTLRIINTVTGCTSAPSAPINVVINSIPSTPTITGANSICSGSSTTLTTTRTLGTNEAFLWSDNSSASTLTVTTAGTYSLRVRNTATGCTSAVSNTITVTVNALPTTPTITGTNSICSGSSTTLTTTRTLGTNEAFLWSDNSSASALTVTTAGTYSLRVRNTATGCTSAASTAITVTVNALPTTPTISGSNSICSGSNTTLTTTRTLGTNEAFLWSDNSSASTLTVTTAGTYSLRVRNTATGCTSAVSNTITVTVNALPTTPTITGANSICSGSSITLSTTRTLLTNEAFLWSNGATSPNINFTTAGTYSLRVRNTATGCTSAVSNTITVTVNALPTTPTITGANSICSGSSTTLTTTRTLGTNEAFLWSDNSSANNLTVTAAGTYSLRVRNTATGCTSAVSNTITVSANALPSTPTIAGANSICSGSSTTLTTTRTLGTNEAFLWSTGATTQNLTVSTAGTYSLRIRNTATGCTSAASNDIAVSVNTLTTPTISGTTAICTGSSTTLTASAASGYLWSTGATTQTITVSTAGSYTVQTIGSGCTSASSTPAVVVVNPIPTAPVITGTNYFCSGGSTVLTSTITTGSYLWSTGATSRSITVTAVGDYSVRIITNGCTSAVSNTYNVTSLPNGTWLGNTTSWTTGSNWCGGNAPGTGTDVTITNIGVMPVLTGTSATCRNLTIAEGRTLAIANGVRLTLRGNLSGLGNIVGVSGSILRIRGNANQTIPGITVGTLVIENNNPNLTLNLTGNVTVLNGITLTDGIINTGSNYLILANTAANPAENATSYIVGNIRTPARNVGTGSISMLGLTIAAGIDNLDTVMIERTETPAVFGSNQGIRHVWKIRAGNQPTNGRQVTLSWSARADNGKNLTALQVYRRPDIGGEWIRVGGIQNGSSRSLTVTTNSFSDWTASDASSPLPVTWASFTGTTTKFGNQLNWSTSSEINNQGFVIERSTNGRNFTKIGFVQGNGTTNAKQHYQFTDKQVSEGYYRLQQLDFDGKTAYSTIIKVGSSELEMLLDVYPNPATDKVTVKTNGTGDINIVNLMGQIVISEPASETNEINISKLPKGVYTIMLNGASKKLVVR